MSTTPNQNRCILVTGAAGQIGTELLLELRNRYGNTNVIGIGRKTKPSKILNKLAPGPFLMNIDVCNVESISSVFNKYTNIDTIYHLAAILSGTGEANPLLCWDVNMNGTINILEIARKRNIKNILLPSSIGAFGPDVADMKLASQTCAMHPESMYGVTKVAGEVLANYYNKKYGMNIRGLRLPGIISIFAMPGGGTTDYAVHIFYDAILKGKYTSFIGKDTALPMMYMPDCINSMIDLMEYEGDLKRYTDFNVTSFSFTPNQIANMIKKYVTGFVIDYKLDFRQKIAESWPDNMDDLDARQQWNWKPKYNLQDMVEDIIYKLRDRIKKTGSIYPNLNQSKFIMAIVIRKNDVGLSPVKDVGPQHRVLLNGKLSHNKFDVVHGVFDVGQGAPLHFHKEDIETFYILKGEFKIECSSKDNNKKIESTIVKPGDYVICPILTYRAFFALQDQSEMLIINGPSQLAEFSKDLWESQFDQTGALRPETLHLFKQKYGIIVESPQSKL